MAGSQKAYDVHTTWADEEEEEEEDAGAPVLGADAVEAAAGAAELGADAEEAAAGVDDGVTSCDDTRQSIRCV